MNDFLFELGTEELPTAAVQELSEALSHQFRLAFATLGIAHGEMHGFGTPRRLAILVRDVAATQASQTKSRKGPAVLGSRDAEGRPSPALLGFAKSCGVNVDALSTEKTDKGEWWSYTMTTPEIPTSDLLPSITQQILADLPIRKAMRWGVGETQFCRPVHWAVMLWGNTVLKTDILGVTTGRLSYGHRFHHSGEVEIATPNEYQEKLLAAHVVVDLPQRQAMIREQINQVAAAQKFSAVIHPDLLAEVAAIVEWPRALLADFDPKFLVVPAEALMASLQGHQKCFALYAEDGKMAPHFIAVANIASKEMSQVKTGNEKVVRARLSDAEFFFQQDKKQGLAAHIPALKHVVFQTQLGSLSDKSTRIAKIMAAIEAPLGLNPQELTRAAELSKCDLLTGMVGEFPELQGIMGYYYATHADESPAVALSLQEQYLPRFAQDDLPSSALGLALSLADRLDTLYGLFAIGQKPTGVKDPFKLRRHALAIARMLLSLPEKLTVTECLQAAADAYAQKISSDSGQLIPEIHAFILERLSAYYQNLNIPQEVLHAVRACQQDWLYDMAQRIVALNEFIQEPQAQALCAMAKRVNNVLAQAKGSIQDTVDPDLFKVSSEHNLWTGITQTEERFSTQSEHLDYPQRLRILVAMQPALSDFFEHVMVMDSDLSLQHNRLALLVHLRVLLGSLADLSHLASITK